MVVKEAPRTVEKKSDKTVPASHMNLKTDEEFWDELIAHIEEGNVIPVIGPELLTVEYKGGRKTFYRIVAEKLLSDYNLECSPDSAAQSTPGSCFTGPITLRRGYELMDAVCAIHNRENKPLDTFHVPINKIIKSQQANFRQNTPENLKNLVSIDSLNLFVTTTSDNLLTTVINEMRYDGRTEVCEVEYAPNLSSDRQSDLPEGWSNNAATVFFLFGKSSASQSNAIHEEDMLEWIYNLQKDPEAGPENLIKHIRGKHLLFIGCALNDWLGRFLVRTSNSKRLIDRRDINEFIVFDNECMDASLILFLERFSKNTKICYYKPEVFVTELLRRWREAQLKTNPKSLSTQKKPVYKNFTKNLKGAIFISYAHEDYTAANNLRAQLQEIAGNEDIAWLDKGGSLEAGDEWETAIRRAIEQNCQLFIPLISNHTQQRREGFFRKEWGWAVERDKGILGRKFIVPYYIDSNVAEIPFDELLVNRRFTQLQIEQALGGNLTPNLITILTTNIREIRRGKFT
ncbi:MAG: toll/interleukin-1 receptor domain-containing protein [Thiohalomonadales bacterium]